MKLPSSTKMCWILILVISSFVSRATSDFASEANALINNHRTVRLDPLLRRALLKALNELEAEAQKKAEAEEKAASARLAANKKLNEAVNSPVPTQVDEIQTTADTAYPTQSVTVQETEIPSDTAPTVAATLQDTQQTESQTNPPATIRDTFIFQTPTPLELQNPEITAVSLPDIESNLITEDKVSKQTTLAGDKVSSTAQAISTTPTSPKQSESPDGEVDIFKAPLVAAFTLHQDSKGTPKGVVPLFRPPNNANSSPNSDFFNSRLVQQGAPLQQFSLQPSLSPPFPQKSPQNFLIQSSQAAGQFAINSGQQQFQRLQQESNSQRFQPSAGPFGFDILSGHQQLPLLQSAVFRQQPPSVTLTPHSQPHNFQSSTFSPFASTSTPTQTTARPFTLFQSSTPKTTFTIPPVTLPLQDEPRFSSPIIVQQASKETAFFLQQEQQKRERLLAEENRLRQLESQAHFRLEQLKRQRQLEETRFRTLPNRPNNQFQTNVQKSLGFDFTPDQFQPVSNRVNRQEAFGTTGNFGFNPHYRTIPDEIYRQRNFRSAQQELAQLLYESGLATHSTGQEDLNIVSKVLALNHERSDKGLNESQRVDGTKVRVSRRSDFADDIKVNQRQGEKKLLVGEIEELVSS